MQLPEAEGEALTRQGRLKFGGGPAAARIVEKILPLTVHGTGLNSQTIGSVNVISVPVDHYLSAEDVAKISAQALQIEHEPKLEIVEPEPVIEQPAQTIEPEPVIETEAERLRREALESEARGECIVMRAPKATRPRMQRGPSWDPD